MGWKENQKKIKDLLVLGDYVYGREYFYGMLAFWWFIVDLIEIFGEWAYLLEYKVKTTSSTLSIRLKMYVYNNREKYGDQFILNDDKK
jgi:hypothetical protein